MKKRKIKIFAIVLAVCLLAGAAVYAATGYGSEEDPLITKSYLDFVVQPELEAALQDALGSVMGKLREDDGQFHLLTLKSGQRVVCQVGTELLLRFGSAKAYAYDSADAALVDTTAATQLKEGAGLTANHLYMVTIQGNGFTAAADNTKVLISGVYVVE